MRKRFWLPAIVGGFLLLATLMVGSVAAEQQRPSRPPRAGQNSAARAEALRTICRLLDIGEGATIADIGAGRGIDTWVFAEIVGEKGKVFSEEISEDLVRGLRSQAAERELPQVVPVLGTVESPCLPESSVDLAYMHQVYHHVTKPHEMLQAIWKSLKPGGYFVVVDRRRGTLQDWVPREERGPKHYWIAETTVVREAREAGFQFVRCAEECWPGIPEQFVLVFRRPVEGGTVGVDPDPRAPLDLDVLAEALAPNRKPYQSVAVIALGEARNVLPKLIRDGKPKVIDIVLEEWATRKDERPPVPPGVEVQSVMTENGRVELAPHSIDGVFFLDTYSLLFHQNTLLECLKTALRPGGRIYVLDRRGEFTDHRLASHHRAVSPELVRQEMNAAGFRQVASPVPPGKDRFVLVFEADDEPAASQK
ncbi:MAG: methyltransferase domain-containing protein [Planctomycetota bacterium]|nr:MAG: methyltransferase domain-containing protein [Planctomycetota bacterium]